MKARVAKLIPLWLVIALSLPAAQAGHAGFDVGAASHRGQVKQGGLQRHAGTTTGREWMSEHTPVHECRAQATVRYGFSNAR